MNLVNLKEEIEHVLSYLTIQQIRYSNQFSYDIDIDSNLLNYKVLKLSLQPLVENAILHGIHPDDVKDAPHFVDVYARIQQIVRGRMVLVYNADFDIGILDGMCERRELPEIDMDTECVMEWHAQWWGEWSSYHKSYRWQRLWGGDHSAVGDCFATLKVLKEMADG